MEKEASVGGAQHCGVVVRISRSDNSVVQSFECLNCMPFLVDLTKLEVSDAVIFNDQSVTKQSGHSQLTHERTAELFKSV